MSHRETTDNAESRQRGCQWMLNVERWMVMVAPPPRPRLGLTRRWLRIGALAPVLAEPSW